MTRRRVSLLRRIVSDFRDLHWALKRYYLRRARRRTPQQEVEDAIARLNRELAHRDAPR